MLIDATAALVYEPTICNPSGEQERPSPQRLAGMFLLDYTNPNTIRAYRSHLTEFFAWCGEWNLNPLDAKRADVSLYARIQQDDGRKASTVCRKLTALKSFYQWCVDEERLDRNPVARVKRPIVPEGEGARPDCLTGVELARCVQVAEWEGGDTYALICLLAMNALRINEVVTADIEDMGQERHNTTLKIMGKGTKPAVIALPMQTVFALKQAHGTRTSGALILSGRGARLTRDSAGRTVHRVARAAGIKDKNVTPHTFRRAAITLALADGVDARRVQKNLARHSKMETTETYAYDVVPLDQSVSYVLAGAIAQRAW